MKKSAPEKESKTKVKRKSGKKPKTKVKRIPEKEPDVNSSAEESAELNEDMADSVAGNSLDQNTVDAAAEGVAEENKSSVSSESSVSFGSSDSAEDVDNAADTESTQVLELLKAAVAELGGEERSGQSQMVEAVYSALTRSGHLLVQAGTGTGKSLGYLIPAACWSLETGQKVIISTATLALQRQIIRQDAPLVAQIIKEKLGENLQVAVLKGWNNYICLRKSAGGYPEEGTLLSRAEGEFGATATGAEVVRARNWAAESSSGDRDDLVPGVDERVWEQVSLPKQECLGEKCPVRISCFPYLAREAALAADIVVTNHAMLGVEAAGTPILPPAAAFIVDEAHELVDRVTAQLSWALSKYEIISLARSLRQNGLSDSNLDDSANDFSETLAEIPEGRIREIPQALQDVLLRLQGRVGEAAADIAGMSGRNEEEAAKKIVLRARAGDLLKTTEKILGHEISSGRLVAWKSVSPTGSESLQLAPLQVASAIADSLFTDRAAVLTSATLKLNNSFHQLAGQAGFTLPAQGEWEGIDVGSPFEPEKQAILYIAKNLPRPGRDGYGNEHLAEILDLITAAGGGALCLFTSRAGAEKAAAYVRDRCDLPIFCQGDDQLPTLLELFAADESASLFGTISLWQGVDVPGHTCHLVIIDRIPFPCPDDPLVQARSEAAQKQGKSGFMEVSATQAALLLAQGAGRLLRSRSDKGMVAILDSRLATARYRHYLLSALPTMWSTEDGKIARAALQRLRDSRKSI